MEDSKHFARIQPMEPVPISFVWDPFHRAVEPASLISSPNSRPIRLQANIAYGCPGSSRHHPAFAVRWASARSISSAVGANVLTN